MIQGVEDTDAIYHDVGGTVLKRATTGIMVLTLMSIDTILVILNTTSTVGMMLYLLTFSGLIRLLFVQAIAEIVERNPGIRLFVIFLLGIIGLELIVQGFGFDKEVTFNTLVLLALCVAILYQLRKNPKNAGEPG